ncbi:hypothetical protein C810_02984 [Lachnospiraceae bacterium A2]|nr:hypothetical protein C810_02984 [Lachnospiraceae bacterium A2]
MAMRRANGSGNVVKMKGNRRKPCGARVAVGWAEDGKQILKNIAYFELRKEADKALADCLSCPYDLTATQMTFKELYEAWQVSGNLGRLIFFVFFFPALGYPPPPAELL